MPLACLVVACGLGGDQAIALLFCHPGWSGEGHVSRAGEPAAPPGRACPALAVLSLLPPVAQGPPPCLLPCAPPPLSWGLMARGRGHRRPSQFSPDTALVTPGLDTNVRSLLVGFSFFFFFKICLLFFDTEGLRDCLNGRCWLVPGLASGLRSPQDGRDAERGTHPAATCGTVPSVVTDPSFHDQTSPSLPWL